MDKCGNDEHFLQSGKCVDTCLLPYFTTERTNNGKILKICILKE